MHLFIESGTREGLLVFPPHIPAKANNHSMSCYNPTQLSSYLMYLDTNKLTDGQRHSHYQLMNLGGG